MGQDSFPVAELRVANGMIVLPYKEGASSKDPRQRAGADAERQMAHYLHRAFKDDPNVCVLHGLRIEDPDQPEQNGAPGVCQIDHLLLHRWGVFIVESKSVSQEVRVRPDGTEGDEWSHVWQGRESGMPSPIRQAQRQSEFLRTILQRYRAELVGRKALGFRTVSRVMVGTDQRGFKRMPMQLVISVSDRGRITRMDGWTKPRKPFQVYVTKADLVPDKIARVIKRHRKGASLVGTITWTNEYGLWDMQEEEVLTVAEFLASRNSGVASASLPASPQTTAEPANPTSQDKPSPEPPCKHCGSGSLNAQWGKFGYYWRAHRKNNHPKPAWRQVRLEIEGLDWSLCPRAQTGISMVAKR